MSITTMSLTLIYLYYTAVFSTLSHNSSVRICEALCEGAECEHYEQPQWQAKCVLSGDEICEEPSLVLRFNHWHIITVYFFRIYFRILNFGNRNFYYEYREGDRPLPSYCTHRAVNFVLVQLKINNNQWLAVIPTADMF